MELFLLVVKFLPVGILFLILYNVKWGMIAYFLYIFLVPIPTLGVLPVSLLTLTLMGMSVYKFGVKKTKESLGVASPYLFLLLALGIVMPLTPTPFPFQFWIWRTDLINGMRVTGVKISPRNIFILDQGTQDAVLIALKNFYNMIDFEFWLICADRPLLVYSILLEL